MDRKESKNLRWDVLNDKCISTGYIPKCVSFGYIDSWETFVWNWNSDSKVRTNWIGEYYHHSQKDALKFHNRLLRIYSYLHRRKNR